MEPNETLLKAIRARMKRGGHNYGILTADAYARTLLDCAGSDLCYRYAGRRGKSFNDALKRAGRTLTYNNPDMVTEETMPHARTLDVAGQTIEVPKNTLLIVKHVVTTPRKDRDGDVLRTQGARPDPKMLMLWQHTHTLPIGKTLAVAEHNAKRLSMYSAVVDVNALAHDAVVMIENKMGRFSHGFRALEFSEIKADPGKPTGPGGFDVKSFEIMEISLVSVPSNVDAEVEEIILDMVEGGKLKSPLLKGIGKQIRGRRAKAVPVTVDANLLINGKPALTKGGPDEDEEDDDDDIDILLEKGGRKGCGCGCGAPKEADDGDDEGGGDKGAKPTEVSQANADAYNDMGGTICPTCGITAGDDGKCPQCKKPIKKSAGGGQKAGRVLSAANYKALQEVAAELAEVEKGVGMWSAKSACKKCIDKLNAVLKAATPAEAGPTATEAAATFLTGATKEERDRLHKVLEIMAAGERKEAAAARYRVLTGGD